MNRRVPRRAWWQSDVNKTARYSSWQEKRLTDGHTSNFCYSPWNFKALKKHYHSSDWWISAWDVIQPKRAAKIYPLVSLKINDWRLDTSDEWIESMEAVFSKLRQMIYVELIGWQSITRE